MRTKPTTRTSTARTSNPDTGRTAPTTLRTRADKAAASVKAAAQDVGRGATRLGRRALRTVRRLVTNVETRLAAPPQCLRAGCTGEVPATRPAKDTP